jgi:triphosphoribosyl-dephospho-CoA synthase
MMSVLSNVVRSTVRNPANGTAAARRLARLARQALIAEAELTPKPGLVDRRGEGAHTDLSLEVMRRSAVAIEPYFCRMAIFSKGARPSQSMREQLALTGRHAELAMLAATGGSNSHKGAIWALGLLVSAAAMCHEDGARAAAVATKAKDIASFEDRAMPRLVTHGDAVARRYGVPGARGEALCGFPHVMEMALPTLRRRRQHGATEEVARLDALLSVMSRLDDTCVLYRGGEAALAIAKQGATAVKAAGGSGTALGRQRLRQLDRRLLDLNVSPGGSADLLAAALFLDAVERRQNEVAPDESVAEHSESQAAVSRRPAEVSQTPAEAFHGTH